MSQKKLLTKQEKQRIEFIEKYNINREFFFYILYLDQYKFRYIKKCVISYITTYEKRDNKPYIDKYLKTMLEDPRFTPEKRKDIDNISIFRKNHRERMAEINRLKSIK